VFWRQAYCAITTSGSSGNGCRFGVDHTWPARKPVDAAKGDPRSGADDVLIQWPSPSGIKVLRYSKKAWLSLPDQRDSAISRSPLRYLATGFNRSLVTTCLEPTAYSAKSPG